MNMLGKIFVVVIMLMSFMFMTMALMVYANHKNWKAIVELKPEEAGPGQQVGLKYQLEQAKKRHQDLQDEYDKYKAQVAEEKQAQRQALAKLETQRDELVAKRDDLQKERDVLNEKDQKSVAALDTAQTTLTKLTEEVEGLRKEIRLAQEQTDKQFKEVLVATDTIHQVKGELARTKDREQQVASQVAKLKDVLKRHNIPETDTSVRDLHGKVLAINGENMVEVSIGKDDGLNAGDTLEVYRGSKYLGRLKVLRLDTDRAVAQVLPEFRLGIIQKGDDVATRFKIGLLRYDTHSLLAQFAPELRQGNYTETR
jgi:hypothetical protein